jgi:hypothetical protein
MLAHEGPAAASALPFRSGLSRARALPWGALLTIAAIAVGSWPVVFRSAQVGLDPSWEAALHLAITSGTHFGSDLVFTYGPLGFLAWTWPWFSPLTLLSFAFVGATHVSICAVVVAGARRVLPAWQAPLLAYLTVRAVMVLQPYEALFILVFAGSAAVLLRGPSRPSAWLAVLGGVVTAIGLLGKLNAGVFIAAIVLITILAAVRPGWRSVLVFAASGGASFLGLWLATGQRLSDLPSYVTASLEIIRGYSEAMGADRNAASHWVILAYFLVVLLVARVAAGQASDRPLARRIGLLLVGTLIAFAFFKTGFVRGGTGYALSAVLVGLFAVAGDRTARPVFLAVFVAVFVSLVGSSGSNPSDLVNPTIAVRSLAREAAVVIDPWKWSAAEQQTREQLRAGYALEPAILDRLRGYTVHVDPWQTAVLVAWPELRWKPLPVFQSYSAYTSALDSLNAAALRGPNAPQRILRETTAVWPGGSVPVPVAIDSRDRWFDGPAAMLETFCRYDEVAATTRWEVLALTSRRCGTPERLATVVAQPGEPVAVPTDPRPGRFVIVRVHGIDDSPLDRVITTLSKSSEWYVTLNGTDKFRLVPGTAGDGLLMATPTSIVRSEGFAFGPPTRSIAIAPRNTVPKPGPLTFEFLSVPLVGP